MRSIFTILILIFSLALFLTADTKPAAAPAKGDLYIFAQQDLKPFEDRLSFNEGFTELLSGLNPETNVRFFTFIQDKYVETQSAEAGSFTWPMDNFAFSLPVTSTTPYRNFLRFLKENNVSQCDVIFISNGRSAPMLSLVDSEGFLPGESTFSPNRYKPVPDIISYCKKNGVRLIGFYVPEMGQAKVGNENIALSTFRYVVESTKGKAYYSYSTFSAVFKDMREKELNKR